VTLSAGKVNHDEVTCPFHGFRYDDTGKVIEIPTKGKNAEISKRYYVKSYRVKEGDGFI
jgi:phenylpropionate dioxygenase-like ring-hydroxylating dioxygenase large terminal subunit